MHPVPIQPSRMGERIHLGPTFLGLGHGVTFGLSAFAIFGTSVRMVEQHSKCCTRRKTRRRLLSPVKRKFSVLRTGLDGHSQGATGA